MEPVEPHPDLMRLLAVTHRLLHAATQDEFDSTWEQLCRDGDQRPIGVIMSRCLGVALTCLAMAEGRSILEPALPVPEAQTLASQAAGRWKQTTGEEFAALLGGSPAPDQDRRAELTAMLLPVVAERGGINVDAVLGRVFAPSLGLSHGRSGLVEAVTRHVEQAAGTAKLPEAGRA